jgi:hypothetical protein
MPIGAFNNYALNHAIGVERVAETIIGLMDRKIVCLFVHFNGFL